MPLVYAKCKIKGVETYAMIDSGATLSAISMKLVEKLGLKNTLISIS